MKKILIAIAVVLMALVAWRVIVQIKEKKAEANGPDRSKLAVTVELAPVTETTVRDLGQFSGSLKAISGYTIAPKVSGRLIRLLVNLGDRVNRGQLVAVLDDEVFQQQLEQAWASLAVAEAQVNQTQVALRAAEADWNSMKALFAKGYATQSEMDRSDTEKAAAQAKYEIAQADAQKARSQVRTAEIQLSYTQIKAEFNGGGNTRVVGERFADEGNLLAANAPILTLVDYSSVTAQIDVIERDYAKIRIGQAVQVKTDAYPNRSFSGRLARLAPILQDASRQARVEIDIPNPQGLLKPGMFVRVETEYARHDGVPAVPRSAVVQRAGKKGVFLADEETLTVSFVPITTGITDGDWTEVVEPALSGKVVILGQDQLQEGSKIKLPAKTEDKKAKAGANT